VIILLTGSPAAPHGPGSSGIGAAFGAVDNFTRSLAIEVGAAGVRVVCPRTAANPDSRTLEDTVEAIVAIAGVTREQASVAMTAGRLLPESPHTTDTARAWPSWPRIGRG
jgi:NAD(P)-dependent dehydrogenase (short-subunit alcohol dehydrogenase family)